MAQNLCASCRQTLKHYVGDYDVGCNWAWLSDDQRDYLKSKGVSPTTFCHYRAAENAAYFAELGPGDGIDRDRFYVRHVTDNQIDVRYATDN